MTETSYLYNNEVRIEFSPAGHRYAIFDREKQVKAPSVTTVSGLAKDSAPLINWSANCSSEFWRDAIQPDTPYAQLVLEEIYEQARKAHRQRKEEAGNIGTEVHRTLEAYFKQGSEPVEADPRVQSCVSAARLWLQEHQVEKIDVERRIFSRRYKYTGTLDKLARIDGVLSLLDWKSSNGLYEDMLLQTAAYVGAYEEETGERIEQRWLIRLDKLTGIPEPHVFPRRTLKADLAAFHAALDLYKRLPSVKAHMRQANNN